MGLGVYVEVHPFLNELIGTIVQIEITDISVESWQVSYNYEREKCWMYLSYIKETVITEQFVNNWCMA